MQIRPATPEDLPEILEFWNPLIRETTVTFSSEEKTLEGLGRMIATRRDAGREFLVADDQFRGGNGYRHAMEHTIILSEAARGRGVGRALMAAIEAHARRGGAHTMVAGVSAENEAGVSFHLALGYETVGRLPQSGRKFGRWLDLVLLQKIL